MVKHAKRQLEAPSGESGHDQVSPQSDIVAFAVSFFALPSRSQAVSLQAQQM
jgi:hypothetical protein